MYIAAAELLQLSVSKETLDEKIENGEWHVRTLSHADNETEKEILVSSLPQKLQLAWAKSVSALDYPEQIEVLLSEAAEYGLNEHDKEAAARLTDIDHAERLAWMREAIRMAKVVGRYSRINPKRQRNSSTENWTFVAAVYELGAEKAG